MSSRTSLAALATIMLFLAACTSDDPPAVVDQSPSPTPPLEASPTVPTTPTTEASVVPDSDTPDAVIQLTLGEPMPFPDNLAVTIEMGCSDCDTPSAGFARIYRDVTGVVRVETLFEPPMDANPRAYMHGATFTQYGADAVISICSAGYCGGLGLPNDPQVTLYRSRDGGVTWTELSSFDQPWAPYAVQDDSIVLGKGFDGNGAAWSLGSAFVREPSGEPVTPPNFGDDDEQSTPVALVDGELLWRTADGSLVLGNGGTRAGLGYMNLTWDIGVGGRHTMPFLSVPPQGASRVTVFARRGFRTVLQLSPSELLAASFLPGADRAQVGLVLIDLNTSTIHPIADLPSPAEGIRGPVAVQHGPFVRVVTGEGECAPVRGAPAASAATLECVADGVLLRRIGTGERDGWLPVAIPAGVEGWAQAEALELNAEVMTPARPAEGSPFGGADLVDALATVGIDYRPQDHGTGCTGAGSHGVAYGGPSVPASTLWVYPSANALRNDWELPTSGPPTTKLDHCPLDSSFAYWNENLLLVFGDDRLWTGREQLRRQITAAFLALGGDAAPPQEPTAVIPRAEPMTVWFPSNDDPKLGGYTVEDELAGQVTVFADGLLCGTFEAAGGGAFFVGASDQPDGCHRQGAALDLVSGRGHRLSQSFVFKAGAIVPFLNFAPYPPHTTYPDYICDFLEAEGLDRVECQVVGPPSGGPQ